MNGDQLHKLELKFAKLEGRFDALDDSIRGIRDEIVAALKLHQSHEAEADKWKDRIRRIEMTCESCPGLRQAQTRHVDERIDALTNQHREMWTRINSNTRYILLASGGLAVLVFLLSDTGTRLLNAISGG